MATSAIGFVATAVAGLVCYWAVLTRGLALGTVGYNVGPAERVLRGEVPYRDFFYNYTPGLLWLNALLMRILGPSLMTVSVGLLVFKCATLIVLFAVARRVIAGWPAFVPVVLTLSWIGYGQGFAVYPTQYSMLFVLLGLVCVLNHDRTGRLGWALGAGALVGVVFVFKHNIGITLFATGMAALVWRECMVASIRRSRRSNWMVAPGSILMYAIGFAIVVGAMAAWLARQGALGAMIEHFARHAVAYREQRAVAPPPLKLAAPIVLLATATCAGALIVRSRAPRLFPGFVVLGVGALSASMVSLSTLQMSAFAAVVYLPAGAFAGALVAALVQLMAFRHRGMDERPGWWRRHGELVIVGCIAIGAYTEVYPRADPTHVVRTLPPVFVFLVAIVSRFWAALEARRAVASAPSRREGWLMAAVPLSVLIVTGVNETWRPHLDCCWRFAARTPISLPRTEGILATPEQAAAVTALGRLIEQRSEPGDPIFAFDGFGSAFYFLSGRINPTRFDWWGAVGIEAAEREEVLRLIDAGVPKLVLMREARMSPILRDRVLAAYHRVGEASPVAVYERRP